MAFSRLKIVSFIVLFSLLAWATTSLPDAFTPGGKIHVDGITLKQAHELFQEFQKTDIPFGYPVDGCYARATKMALIAEKKGIKMGKIFAEGDLRVQTTDPRFGTVNWAWHVAPILSVHQDGKDILMVFDPSLFDRPVTEEVWLEKMKGRIKEVYYTERFQYFAKSYNNNQEKKKLEWMPEDVLHGEEKMREYSRLIQPKKSDVSDVLQRFAR